MLSLSESFSLKLAGSTTFSLITDNILSFLLQYIVYEQLVKPYLTNATKRSCKEAVVKIKCQLCIALSSLIDVFVLASNLPLTSLYAAEIAAVFPILLYICWC